MTTLAPLDPSTATSEAAELLEQVTAKFGRAPNMTRAMANSPAVLRAYLELSGALGGGVLTQAVRERLAIASAEYNGCGYCLSAHTYVGQHVAKVDTTELENARAGRSADPHVQALLTLSDAIARNRGRVDDATLDAARRGGVTDAELGEVIGNLALNTLTNYFNMVGRVANDWPITVIPGSPSA